MRTHEDLDAKMKEFREKWTSRGLRMTPQRTEVFRAVAAAEDHPGAETILERVRGRIPNISLDTVYRVLYRLEDEGLIRRVQVSSDRLRFDGDADNHHHFLCGVCGTIRDFTSEAVDRLALPEEVRPWGRIEERHLLLRGVCRKCLEKRGAGH